MSFVKSDEDVQASKDIANSVMEAVTSAPSHGVALHALMMVLTYYLATVADHGILSTSDVDAVVDDFHRFSKEKLAAEGLGAVH